MDALTTTYRFSCPQRGEAIVRLSSFRADRAASGRGASCRLLRSLRLLAAATSTSASSPRRSSTGSRWVSSRGRTFVNLMTSRHDDLSADLRALALTRIEAGEWPWSFFCYLGGAGSSRDAVVVHAACAGWRSCARGSLGLAVRCPVCGSVSINVVSEPHVDLPFWNDPHVGVVEHVFGDDAAAHDRGISRRAAFGELRRARVSLLG